MKVSLVSEGQLRRMFNDTYAGLDRSGKIFAVLRQNYECGPDPKFWDCFLSDGSMRIYSELALETYSETIE